MKRAKPLKYANGGEVRRSFYKPKTKAKTAPRARPEQLGTGAAARAGEALRDRRAEQMRRLGLRDGGPIRGKTKAGIVDPPRTMPTRPPMPPPSKGPAPRRIGGRRPRM